jgi:hypothetical protein
MILIPIIALIVYFACTGKKTLKDASAKEMTMKSVDASNKLYLVFIVGAILLAILAGHADL